MLDQQVRAELRNGGLKGTYDVTLPPEGPILDLVVDSPSPESALQLQRAVIAQVSTQLRFRPRTPSKLPPISGSPTRSWTSHPPHRGA